MKGVKMKRNLIIISLIAMLMGGLSQAAVEEGDTEISLHGSYSKMGATNLPSGTAGFEYEIFELAAGYGYFINDNVQVGVTGGYSDYNSKSLSASAGSGNRDYRIRYWSLGATGKYHFMVDNQLVPYLGGELLYNHGIDIGTRDSDHWLPAQDRATGWSWGIGGGLRYEVSKSSDFILEYLFRSLEDDWGKRLGVDDMHLVRLGLVYKFNK